MTLKEFFQEARPRDFFVPGLSEVDLIYRENPPLPPFRKGGLRGI